MSSKKLTTIYTIGHSTLTANEFVNILKHIGIEYVIDIRRLPGSKINPQYNKSNLKKYLAKSGIEYIWMGEKLGGYRADGYLTYMETQSFKTGINELENLGRKFNLVMMCAEKFYSRCHRRFISDELVRRGWRVSGWHGRPARVPEPAPWVRVLASRWQRGHHLPHLRHARDDAPHLHHREGQEA